MVGIDMAIRNLIAGLLLVTPIAEGLPFQLEAGRGLFQRLLDERRGTEHVRESNTTIKCATPLVFSLHEQAVVGAQKAEVVLAPAVQQKSRLSPSGRFRIHYDTVNVHQPAMLDSAGNPIPDSFEEYVDSVGAIFDFSYTILVETLGFDAPPSDGSMGGGPEYDIYIEQLGSNTFGMTVFGDLISTAPNFKYASYIVIDNDYYEIRTPGLNGLRVTAAHEFHHAIQLGSYGVWNTPTSSDFYFYEITSSWLEDVVYPEINDYQFDAQRYFNQFRDVQGRSYSFTHYSLLFPGYERAIWAHYLARRYGDSMIRQVWEEMKDRPFLNSLFAVLQKYGTDIALELSTFSVWNYYTADRANPVISYTDGNLFPRFSPNSIATFTGFEATVATSFHPLSTQFFTFTLQGDTVIAILSNVDFESARRGSSTLTGMSLTARRGDVGGAFQRLEGGLSFGLSVAAPTEWRVAYFTSSKNAIASINEYPAPNPFRLGESSRLVLPSFSESTEDVEISVLSSSLDRLFSRAYSPRNFFGRWEVVVPAEHLKGKVSSGLHFVVLSNAAGQRQWKVLFLR
jgi:hypothetical protein